MEVQFAWKEVQPDRSLVQRSHTQLVDKLPFRYEINVGGEDHPVMESFSVNLKGSASAAAKYGYSDGKDNPQAKKYVYTWQTVGKSLSVGKKVTTNPLSVKMFGAQGRPNSGTAGPNSGKLTDGVVGPTFAGGWIVGLGESWPNETKQLDIDLDLEKPTTCWAFAIQITSGWPWPDVWKGDWKEKIEVFTSDDGQAWTSQGLVNLNRWRKDTPINFMAPDDEQIQGYNFDLVAPKPVSCRYVRWRINPNGHAALITEVQALDFVKYEPFDIRLALPDEKVEPTKVDGIVPLQPTWDDKQAASPASLIPQTFEPAYTKLWPDRKARLKAATQPATAPADNSTGK